MLSFKQYLQESDDNAYRGRTQVVYTTSFKFDTNTFSVADAEKFFESEKLSYSLTSAIGSSKNQYWVIITFPITSEFNTLTKDTLIKNLLSKKEEFNNSIITVTEGIVQIDGFPTFKIKHKQVAVNCNFEENFPVENLSKISTFLECQEFIVYGSYTVKSAVLDILRIKGLEIFNFHDDDVENGREWQPIIKKHAADHNVSAAQTELFKNGLKKYAKF